MDLDKTLNYILDHGSNVNLIELKLHKSWCFILNGTIDTKLSTDRRHIHDKKQVLMEFPTVAGQVSTTVTSLFERTFPYLEVPHIYGKSVKLSQLLEVIKGIDVSSVNGSIQSVYLCLSLVTEYLLEYEFQVTPDEGLLLCGLMYIIYKCLSRMSHLAVREIVSLPIEVYFNECDLH